MTHDIFRASPSPRMAESAHAAVAQSARTYIPASPRYTNKSLAGPESGFPSHTAPVSPSSVQLHHGKHIVSEQTSGHEGCGPMYPDGEDC